MTVDPIADFVLEVERFYASLISSSAAELRVAQLSILRPGISVIESSHPSESSLAGRLLYAGELNGECRALVVAANIAGAATLTASASAEAGKQAMRDGVVDFLVTTLDEALRILKNEVRKHETVAVCVGQAPETVEEQMRKRGVLPDLQHPFEVAPLKESHAILFWRVTAMPANLLPKIDAIAKDCLQQNLNDPTLAFENWESARRWLRLSPRYLGRLALGVRVLRCGKSAAALILERLRTEVEEAGIAHLIEIKRISELANQVID